MLKIFQRRSTKRLKKLKKSNAMRFQPAQGILAAVSSLLLTAAACNDGTSGLPPEKNQAAPHQDVHNIGALAEMTLGSPEAPVTLIEYASVTCPACAYFHENVFPQLKANYIEAGKVQFIFREFPAHNPPLSIAGSMVARCAADKGGAEAYFAVVDKLFRTQNVWAEGSTPRAELQKIAAEAGLSQDAFDGCIRREDLVSLINDSAKSAQNLYKISGTPSFVLNEKLIRGVGSAEDFLAAVDEALEKAGE